MKYQNVTLSVLATIGLLVFSFQNCSNAKFSSLNGDLVSKADATVSTDDPNTGDGTPTDNTPVVEPTPAPTPAPTPVPQDPTDPKHPKHAENPDHDQDDYALNYACVLDGPGKSELLGYIDNALVSQTSTPDTVCTTKSACLDIVSKSFPVKEAVARGYCDSNKHVIRLTADEIETLLNK